MLLFLLFGLFLFRFAQRAFLSLLFHDPPRSTRLILERVPAVIRRLAACCH
jgi:hypothetical protein